MALNNIARIAGHGSHDFLQQEKISLQIIQQYKDGSDPKVLVDAYMNRISTFLSKRFRKINRGLPGFDPAYKKQAIKKNGRSFYHNRLH
jgi:hypothetical protein